MMMTVVDASSRDLALFHALRLQDALPAAALEEQLRACAADGVPLEDELRANGLVPAAALERALQVRERLARRCSTCGEVTYLTPGASITTRPCERCGGPLERSTGRHALPVPPPPAPATGAPAEARATVPVPVAVPAPPEPVTLPRARPPRRTGRLVARVALALAAVFAGKLLADHLHRPRRAAGDPTAPGAASVESASPAPPLVVDVRLPSGAQLGREDLVLCSGDEVLGPLPEEGPARLPRSDGPRLLVLRLQGADYLRAWALPEDDAVELSPLTTAVALVLAQSDTPGLGQAAVLRRARDAAQEEAAVRELAAFLDSSLSVDPRCLTTARGFPGLSHKRLHAVQALDARLR